MDKTIICKTCGAKISKRARRCPYCGEITPNETIGQIVLVIVLAPLIFILVIIIISCYVGWFNVLSLF